MHRVNVAAVAAVITLGFLAGCAMPMSERSVTAYEGARLIVGDGRVIENATLVVDGTKIAQAGAAADVRVPAGATRVSLAGKTVMPMIIDTHVHLSETREALIRDLRHARLLRRERRVEHGHGRLRPARYARRGDSRRRAVSQRGARHHDARAGAHHGALLDYDRGGRPQGGGGDCGSQGRHRQDLGRRPGRQVQEADP